MLKRDYLIILFMSTVLLTLACLTSSALAAPKVGDLNGDGYIDSIDYRFMNRYILSKINDFPVEDNLWVGDINKDDSIDTLDFAFLRKYLTGSIKTIEPIKLQLGSLEGETDSIVSLPLLLKNIPEDGLDKLKFELKFDNEVLEVVNVRNPYHHYSRDINNDTGEIIFDNEDYYYFRVSGDCVYSYIDFKILSEVSQFSTVNYEIEYFKDENDNSYNVSTLEGGVDIRGTETQLIVGEELAFPGENVTLPIKLENVPEEGIDNISFDLDFDNTMISVLDIRSGEIVPVATDLISEINSNDGNMSLSFVNYYEETSNITEDGVFAYLDVQVDGYEETGISKISIDNISADELDEPIFDVENFNKIDGGVHISDESLAVEIDSIDSPEDQTVTVPVRLKDITGSGISEFQFKVNYDTEMLEADDVRLADLEEPILRDYFRRQINHEEGYIKFKYDNKYALSLDEDFLIRDDCVIAYLDFTITDLKSEYTHIELDVDYFSGEQERYKISTINGGIDIDNMQDPFVIEAGNRTGKPGEIITVPVYFKGVPEDEISSCDFWLSFDNEALEVVGIEAGELGANPYTNFDSYFSNEEGFVSFLYIIYSSMPDPDEYISEDGIFAYVDFKIKEDVSPGKYPIDLLKIGAFADYDLNVYSVGYVEGSIAVPGSDKSVVINADTVEGQTYDKVTVPIMLEDIPAGGLDNIELQLKFDEDSLRVTDVRPGEVDGVEFNYLSDNSQYKIDFKYSATNPIKDESILAYIDFLIISQENKYSDFECKTGIITDVNDNQYIGVAKGGVNITGIENPIKLDIGSGSGYPSETITIPVSLDNIPDSGVNICDFKISFNDNNFRLIEVRTGEIVTNPEIFSSEITQGSYRYDEGYVSLKYINTGSETDNIYDDGNIAYLDFEVKENKDLGIFPINIVEDSRYYNPDNNLNYVKLDTSDSQGQLEILNDTITLEIGEAEYYDDARVTVPILIKDIPEEGLEKFDFKLSYDSDKIYLLDAKPGENYKDGFSYDPNYRGEFVLSYNPESIENTSSDKDGVLAYLDVEIKPTDSNYCELDLYYNSDENKYNINDIDGGIDIQSEKLQLKLMNVKTAPGDIVKMPIMIENIAGIGLNGFRIKLNFDPAYFEILDVKKGELLMDDDSYDYYIKIDNQEGELLYGSGIDNYVINDGIFAYIEIKVKESIQDGIYPFELENYNLYNSVYYLGNENIDGSTDVSIEVQDNLENEREINVTMGEEVAMPEENITLPLVIENVPETGISNIDFNINFDQENLSLIGVETCDIVPGSFDISSNINTGEVSISLSSEDDIDGNKIYQDGVIAYIDLQINESALNGFSEVNIESISIDEQDDSGINDDSIEMNDGGVHITDESLTLVMDISEELTYGRNEAIIKIKDLPEDGLSKFKFKLKYDEEAINTFYSSTDMENLIISDFERRLDNEFDYMEFKNNSLQNESMIETIEIASIDLDGEIQIFDASLEFDVDYFANEQNYYKVNTEINIIEKEEDEDNNENDENDEDNNDSDEDTKETFKIEIDNIQGKPGEIVTVPIYFKEISDELAESGIINSDFEIDYNNEIFEVVDVRKGEIVPGPDHILQYSIRNFTDNIFIFFMGSLTSKLVISDNGIYAYIDFKIKEDVPLSTSRIYPISFDGIGGLADYNMGILYPEFIEGSIMVEVDNN